MSCWSNIALYCIYIHCTHIFPSFFFLCMHVCDVAISHTQRHTCTHTHTHIHTVQTHEQRSFTLTDCMLYQHSWWAYQQWLKNAPLGHTWAGPTHEQRSFTLTAYTDWNINTADEHTSNDWRMHHWGTLEQALHMNKLNSAHVTSVWCMSLPPACQLLTVTPCSLSSAHSQKQINTVTTSSDHDQHSHNYISCHYNPLYRQKYTRTYI